MREKLKVRDEASRAYLKQREELIAVIEGKLNQTTSMQPLFTLR